MAECIWSLKNENVGYYLEWYVVRKEKEYTRESKRCNLCTREKLEILKTSLEPGSLNKRSELVNKCRHRAKFLLSAVQLRGFRTNKESTQDEVVQLRGTPRVLEEPQSTQDEVFHHRSVHVSPEDSQSVQDKVFHQRSLHVSSEESQSVQDEVFNHRSVQVPSEESQSVQDEVVNPRTVQRGPDKSQSTEDKVVYNRGDQGSVEESQSTHDEVVHHSCVQGGTDEPCGPDIRRTHFRKPQVRVYEPGKTRSGRTYVQNQ